MNSNGSLSYSTKLDRLIAEHEEILKALRLTRDLIDGQRRERKQRRDDALTAALAAEAIHKSRKAARKPSGRFTDAIVTKRRQKSARFLELFDTETPKRFTGPKPNPFVAKGYLKKTADGYLRTAKEFRVAPR